MAPAAGYEELVAQQLAHLYSSHQYKKAKSSSFSTQTSQEVDLLKSFGYALTPSQTQAWECIATELAKDHPMIHLLNGDVGVVKPFLLF